MTCIVGIVEKGKVYIGGDSAGVRQDLQVQLRKDPKVFKIDEFIFGFTSSFRMGQLLMKSLKPPKITAKDNKDLYKYMTTKFVDEVRKIFKAGGYMEVKAGVEVGGSFLVGLRGHLFIVHSDFQVAELRDSFAALGCGESYALGAMYMILQFPLGQKTPPIKKLEMALETAEKFSGGVRAPFSFVTT